MDDLGERLKVTADQRGEHSYRWQRLGIFLVLAVAFIILFVVAMGTIHTGLDGNREGEFARLITKGWLAGNLGCWGLTTMLPERWMTLKRTWVIGLALNVAAALFFIFSLRPAA